MTIKTSIQQSKGQFFIFGAILIVILFSLGLPFVKPVLSSPSKDLPFIAGNIKSEYPIAFNLGLNQSDPAGVLVNFTEFLNQTLGDKQLSFSAFWIYARNSTLNSNLTIGNFLHHDVMLDLTTPSYEGQLQVPDEEVRTTLVTVPAGVFNLTVEFDGRSSTVEFQRDKACLYVFMEFRRGSDIVKEELVA